MRDLRGRPRKTLPIEPLLRAVEARGGIRALTPDPVRRDRFDSMLEQKQKRVGWRVADEICCEVLGEHPCAIFGEDWWYVA